MEVKRTSSFSSVRLVQYRSHLGTCPNIFRYNNCIVTYNYLLLLNVIINWKRIQCKLYIKIYTFCCVLFIYYLLPMIEDRCLLYRGTQNGTSKIWRLEVRTFSFSGGPVKNVEHFFLWIYWTNLLQKSTGSGRGGGRGGGGGGDRGGGKMFRSVLKIKHLVNVFLEVILSLPVTGNRSI